jgi:lysyl-tRNA synthetase class 1
MPKVNILEYAKEEKGTDLSDSEKNEIENRITVAKKWLQNYAPESVKFTIQENLPDIQLNDEQKTFLTKIAEAISQKEKWTGEELHAKIHEIKTEMNIAPKDAFSAIYLSFLGKDSGPQAGWLLASLDKDFVEIRLKEV